MATAHDNRNRYRYDPRTGASDPHDSPPPRTYETELVAAWVVGGLLMLVLVAL